MSECTSLHYGTDGAKTMGKLTVRMWPKAFVFRAGMRDMKKAGAAGKKAADLGLQGGPGGTCLGQIIPKTATRTIPNAAAAAAAPEFNAAAVAGQGEERIALPQVIMGDDGSTKLSPSGGDMSSLSGQPPSDTGALDGTFTEVEGEGTTTAVSAMGLEFDIPFIAAPNIDKAGDQKMAAWQKFNRFCIVISNPKFYDTRLPAAPLGMEKGEFSKP